MRMGASTRLSAYWRLSKPWDIETCKGPLHCLISMHAGATHLTANTHIGGPRSRGMSRIPRVCCRSRNARALASFSASLWMSSIFFGPSACRGTWHGGTLRARRRTEFEHGPRRLWPPKHGRPQKHPCPGAYLLTQDPVVCPEIDEIVQHEPVPRVQRRALGEIRDAFEVHLQ